MEKEEGEGKNKATRGRPWTQEPRMTSSPSSPSWFSMASLCLIMALTHSTPLAYHPEPTVGYHLPYSSYPPCRGLTVTASHGYLARRAKATPLHDCMHAHTPHGHTHGLTKP